jgi:hypothetical protein
MIVKIRTWEDEYQSMISDCENRESRLSEWEQEFIQSLSEQLGTGRTLSIKQIDRLDIIWEKVTRNG